MDKKKELAKNTIILAIGKICTQFLNFLLLPLYTALLLPEEYGIVDLFNTYVTLLVPIFNWQFETGMFRFLLDYRKEDKKIKEIFSTVVCSNCIQVLIYIIFYLIAQNFISSEYKVFLAIDVGLNIFLNTMLQFPRGLGKNMIYSFGSFISACTVLLLNVVFIAVLKLGAYGMFLATVIGKIVTILFLIISTKSWKYFSIKEYNPKTFKEIFRYSLPLIPNQLSWWVIGTSDRTIVSKIIGVAANGIYSVANKFSSIFITLYNIFNLSWTESVSLHLKENDSENFLKETINSMYNLFSSICLGIIGFMPFLFPILIGKEYVSAYQQIPILMIATMFQVIVGLYSSIYVALKKSVEIAKTSFYAAFINIVINLLLIRAIGLYAASISTLVAYATMGLYRYFDVKKYVDASLKFKNVLLSILIASMAIIAYYVNIKVINILAFIIILIYSLIINKGFIESTFNLVYLKIKKLINSKKKE